MIRLFAALALLCLASQAHACTETVVRPCELNFLQGVKSIQVTLTRVAERVVSHPTGCPSRNFCACGASVFFFGKPIKALAAARAWFRFPRVVAAPNMAAVRPHHIFVLLKPISGNVWLTWDANSGGHKTRVHARSIAGYVIVDPRGAA